MVKTFEMQTVCQSVGVRLRIVDNDEAQGAVVKPHQQQQQQQQKFPQGQQQQQEEQAINWYDSLGRLLELEEKAKKKCYKYPAFIPPGVNLILTLPAVVPWPPDGDTEPIKPVELVEPVVEQDGQDGSVGVESVDTEVIVEQPCSMSHPLLPN